MENGVLLQGFHWYIKPEEKLWKQLQEKVKSYKEMGFSAIWLPPAYKGVGGINDNGYGVYDLYDLGEFNQKGSIETKYGTKEDYLACIQAFQKAGIDVYGDIVLNHKMGADGTEIVNAKEVNRQNTNEIISDDEQIEVYTLFTFPGRNKKYSEPSAWNNYKINHSDLVLSCERLKHSPYVCNGCKSRSGCRKVRWTYYAREADNSYKEVKSEARKGINLTAEEIYKINSILTPLIKKGQTINHLYINHPDILDFSKPSFYNYVNNGVFEFSPLDFPRIVKYKKRKNSKNRRTRKEREILINRKYDDFQKFISNHPDFNIVEMDTVEGLKDENDCFLTLLWRKSKFMLIFKLESQTSEEVSRIFNILQTLIPYDDYKRLFEVILTDNGHEFFDVLNIECMHSTGEQVTKLFFCHVKKA